MHHRYDKLVDTAHGNGPMYVYLENYMKPVTELCGRNENILMLICATYSNLSDLKNVTEVVKIIGSP
jgi:hypothetical protein